MKKQVHKNYIIASNLIFASCGLAIISDLILMDDLSIGEFLINTCLTLMITGSLGYNIRKGSRVATYVLLFLIILALIVTYFMYSELYKEESISTKLMFMIELLLDIGALVLIFMVPKIAAGSEAIDEGL